jgi:hypothetical protein
VHASGDVTIVKTFEPILQRTRQSGAGAANGSGLINLFPFNSRVRPNFKFAKPNRDRSAQLKIHLDSLD